CPDRGQERTRHGAIRQFSLRCTFPELFRARTVRRAPCDYPAGENREVGQRGEVILKSTQSPFFRIAVAAERARSRERRRRSTRKPGPEPPEPTHHRKSLSRSASDRSRVALPEWADPSDPILPGA